MVHDLFRLSARLSLRANTKNTSPGDEPAHRASARINEGSHHCFTDGLIEELRDCTADDVRRYHRIAGRRDTDEWTVETIFPIGQT
jgi:hypothetical protein